MALSQIRLVMIAPDSTKMSVLATYSSSSLHQQHRQAWLQLLQMWCAHSWSFWHRQLQTSHMRLQCSKAVPSGAMLHILWQKFQQFRTAAHQMRCKGASTFLLMAMTPLADM